MPNLPDSLETPNIDKSEAEKTAAYERLERSADSAAEKAGKTEQHYDQSHDIFTK